MHEKHTCKNRIPSNSGKYGILPKKFWIGFVNAGIDLGKYMKKSGKTVWNAAFGKGKAKKNAQAALKKAAKNAAKKVVRYVIEGKGLKGALLLYQKDMIKGIIESTKSTYKKEGFWYTEGNIMFKVLLGIAFKKLLGGKLKSSKGKGAKGLIGKDFEEYLVKKYKGSGSFKVSGREFDGKAGNVWWEAKSGGYWKNYCNQGKQFDKFKSDIGQKAKIAKENGAKFIVYSNSKIPSHVKSFLKKKGINYKVVK